MALLTLNFYSDVLCKDMRIQVCLPTLDFTRLHDKVARKEMWKAKLPVLWFLHGFGGDYKDCFRYSNIERYASEKGIAVIAVEGKKTHYTDQADGGQYSRFIVDELPKFLRSLFPISDKADNNTIMGVSMGGYGALKIGLKHPLKFGKIIALSGGLDRPGVCEKVLEAEEKGEQLEGLFCYCNGENLRKSFGKALKKVRGSQEDCFHLVEVFDYKLKKPIINLYCGRQDANLKINSEMAQLLKSKKFKGNLYVEDGGHNWEYWDQVLKQIIQCV